MMKKVNKNRPQVSSKEIAKRADFSSLMNQMAESGTTPTTSAQSFLTKGWFIGRACALVATVGIAAFLLMHPNEEIQQKLVSSDATKTTQMVEERTDKKPFVCPPVTGLNIPYTSYKVEGNKAKILKYGTGSEVSIPANAFVDIEGNLIVGDVEIQYREFHDPIDFMLSGIPMNYDSAGFAYTFESAGMIEIKGFYNGEEVFIHPAKAINIEMVSNTDDEKFNLYYLNEDKERWEYSGKPPVKQHAEILVDLACEEEIALVPIMADTLASSVNNPEQDAEIVQLKIELDKVQTEIIQLKKCEPQPPKQPDNDNFRFNFDVDKEEFPELSAFGEVEFEVPANSKEFDASFYDITWEDVQVKKSGQDQYRIILILGERTESVLVYPVFKDQSLKNAQEIFTNQMKTYVEKFEQRIKKEEIIKQQIVKRKAEIELAQLERVKQWASAVSNDVANIKKEVSNSVGVILRTFEVSTFGTWNCDTPIPPPKGRVLAAHFNDKRHTSLQAENVFLIEKNLNAVFSYNKIQMKNFTYNPKAENYAFVISKQGKLGIYSLERFKDIPSVDSFDFEMEMADREFKTVAEVKEYFGV